MAPVAGNALGADSILDYMGKSLPIPTSQTHGQPLVKDAYAALALFVHACMLAVGFRLIGLGEDHKIEVPSDGQDVQPLPSEWNASSSYAFRYAHAQSSMEYLVKLNRLGGKALVFGVGLGDDKTASFEVKADDYISTGSLKAATTEGADTRAALRDIFISPGRIADLASLIRLNIIQKLAPGIRKEGYQEESAASQAGNETRPPPGRDPQDRARRSPPSHDPDPHPARPYPFDDPLAAAPRRPPPPGDFPPPDFEDEYELNRPPGRMPLAGQPFGRIGERDLYPPGLGPHDPLRIGPGGGFHGGGGGGMHPTFDDPLFGGRPGQPSYNPRAPPGARYDPVGPGDGPPSLRGPRFPGGGGGGSGGFGGHNPFGGFGSGDFI